MVWGEAADANLLQLEPTAGGRTILDVGGRADGGGRPLPVRYALRSPLLEAAEAAAPRKPDAEADVVPGAGLLPRPDPEFATDVRLLPRPTRS